ncbi:MAG: ImmA/IrrE family metallo-endopeptidase [Sphaerochaetaceae bacterium]|nr:ImmA/IrrE family metallo-endopeptidase [Sphaerochaetaceae bacterium]MDC7237716.1 ImmA/IrrE family metallo-endopeptidase [Sphaerochaetaceae bacterium]
MVKLKINDAQKFEISKIAEEEKRKLGFVGSAPIANDLVNLLEQLHIILLEIPITSEKDTPSFSAAIVYIENQDLTFVGINTADYYDKQLFALAHELYHFFVKTGYHLSRINDGQNDLLEMKANYFASEFILPKEELQKIVFEEFKTNSLKKIDLQKIIRFISRIYCKWWLPYNYIVEKLFEIGAIGKDQKEELLKQDVRDTNSTFARICKTINPDVYKLLNNKTHRISTSPEIIEIIIKNFEDDLISEDDFEKILKMFNMSPSDFGYDIEIDKNSLDELDDFFSEDLEDEN